MNSRTRTYQESLCERLYLLLLSLEALPLNSLQQQTWMDALGERDGLVTRDKGLTYDFRRALPRLSHACSQGAILGFDG